jgi:hypothetical protein
MQSPMSEAKVRNATFPDVAAKPSAPLPTAFRNSTVRSTSSIAEGMVLSGVVATQPRKSLPTGQPCAFGYESIEVTKASTSRLLPSMRYCERQERLKALTISVVFPGKRKPE